jgi:hypothetical protein
MMTLAMQHMTESERRMQPGPVTLSIPDIRNPRVKQELAAAQQAGASGKATLQLHTADGLDPALAELWAELVRGLRDEAVRAPRKRSGTCWCGGRSTTGWPRTMGLPGLVGGCAASRRRRFQSTSRWHPGK